MAMEMSADTYDWERIKAQGENYVAVLADLAREQEELPATAFSQEPTGFGNSVIAHFKDALGVSGRVLSDESGEYVVVKLPADGEGWRTYEVEFQMERGNVPVVEFTIRPDFLDARTIFEGKLTPDDFDENHAYEYLDFLFDVCREAICTVAQETHLSEREAEVFLASQRWDDETVSEFMQIPTSNLTTYRNRIEEKRESAKEDLQKAERTLELLD